MTDDKNTNDDGQDGKEKTDKRTFEQGGNYNQSADGPNKDYVSGTKIPLDKVEKMFTAYSKKQTMSAIQEATGVSEHTASKYVNKGDPSRQLLSFKDRLAKRRDLQDKRIAATLADNEQTLLEATMGALAIVRYALVGFSEKMENKEDIGIDPHRIPGMLKDLSGIIRYAKGDPDAKKEVEDKYKQWTTEELTEYYLQGILPEHSKNSKDAPRYNN